MIAYRIADGRHPIFDPTGAMLHGGRWNSAGQRVIYAAATYAGALLEVLVHANLSRPPKNHMSIRIEIPDEVQIDELLVADLPGWDAPDMRSSRAYGDEWLRSNRSAVLVVPSVVTRGYETNLLVNTAHPDFTKIKAAKPEPVNWDLRLFPLAEK